MFQSLFYAIWPNSRAYSLKKHLKFTLMDVDIPSASCCQCSIWLLNVYAWLPSGVGDLEVDLHLKVKMQDLKSRELINLFTVLRHLFIPKGMMENFRKLSFRTHPAVVQVSSRKDLKNIQIKTLLIWPLLSPDLNPL